MPVKIINEPTDSSSGTISLTDLKRMQDAFINDTYLSLSGAQQTEIKKYSVGFMLEDFTEFLSKYKDADMIRINFALHLDHFTACNGTDYSKTLTVVVEAADFIDPDDTSKGFTSKTNVDDYVLIPGYKNNPDILASSQSQAQPAGEGVMAFAAPLAAAARNPCCPSAHP